MITTKLLKFSPLVAIIVALAVCGTLVGATVLLTSNTATSTGTVISSDSNGFTVSVGQPSVLTSTAAYATDTSGVNYAITSWVPENLQNVVATITVLNEGGHAMAYTDTVVAIMGYAYGTNAGYTANSVSYTVPLGNVNLGSQAWTLNIVYNVPGTYDVSVSLTGTAL